MNLLKKSAVALFFLPVMALTACGNGLVNEKKVDAQQFATAVAGTESKNTYNVAEAKQKLSVTGQGSAEGTYNYNYNSLAKKWVPTTTPAWTIDHASDVPAGIIASFATLGITSYTIDFYTADNGFRIYSTGSGVVKGANTDSVIEYLFNEAGFTTKFHQKTVATASGASATTEVDVNITYKTAN